MVSLLALAVLVRVQGSECTTEPAPAQPEVSVLKAKRGTLRVRVVGAGHYCAAGWSATVGADGAVTLLADDSVDAPACPSTCAITLRVSGLARGWHDVTIDGVTKRARVR
jgi:hypothetical protein